MEKFQKMVFGCGKDRDSGFSLRFRLLLGYHNLALRDVSDVTGAAISTVSTWRNGRVPSSRSTIDKIAQLFHVTPSYLLCGSVPESQAMDIDQILLKNSAHFSDGLKREGRDNLLRQKIEDYVGKYLDEAEKYEGGLDHAWLQIVKDFPLHWFNDARNFVALRDLPPDNIKEDQSSDAQE